MQSEQVPAGVQFLLSGRPATPVGWDAQVSRPEGPARTAEGVSPHRQAVPPQWHAHASITAVGENPPPAMHTAPASEVTPGSPHSYAPAIQR
jgi:hypothetical protein